MQLMLSAFIFMAASTMLINNTPFYGKKTMAIYFLALAFALAYSASAALLWSAGFALSGIIAFVAGLIFLVYRMFKDALMF